MILVSVGTFLHGFDELVAAADRACRELDLAGLAQIGHSRTVPEHLAWARFLPEDELRQHLATASLVVCHGGMGILGEAMRAGRPIVAVPRRGPPTPDHPANDQQAFVLHLAKRHPIRVCLDPADLGHHLRHVPVAPIDYRLRSDTPELIRTFLEADQSRPAFSS